MVSGSLYCQEANYRVAKSEKVVGINLVTNAEISAIEFKFPDRLYGIHVDTTSNLITAKLRGLSKNGKWVENKGVVLQYDVRNNSVKWTRNIFYPFQSLKQKGKIMILSKGNKSYRIDINDGKTLWKINDEIYFVDTVDNVGLGKKTKGGSGISSRLEGINLQNGDVVWKRYLNHLFDWNNVFYINDSLVIIVAKGLHLINLKNGKGWDYNAITGRKEKTGKGKFLSSALNLTVGIFTMGTSYAMPMDMGYVSKNNSSNVIIDSSNVYYASKMRLVKLNKQTGKVVWDTPFPKDLASSSIIFFKDSLVYMLNLGHYTIGRRQFKSGIPFIAAYERNTGKQKYLKVLKKDDLIHDFSVRDSAFYMIFNHRVVEYSRNTGKLLSEKVFPEKKNNSLGYFVRNQVFIRNKNGNYVNLTKNDSTELFVFTREGIIGLDKQLNQVESLDYRNVFVGYLKTGNYRFIMKNGQTWIIDKKGQQIAELDVNKNAFLIGNTLYDPKGKSLYKIDLSKIIGKNKPNSSTKSKTLIN